MARVQGKVAIVTGGGNGIGEATCRVLAREGASVAVLDIRDQDAEAVARSIEEQGGTAASWRLDVSKEDDVRRLVAEVVDKFGRIDILVNNAGIAGPNKPGTDVTEQEFDSLFAVNVKGGFFCTKHIVPRMRETGGGSIVYLGSIYALIGNTDSPLYHSTKGAIKQMAKTDAMLYARDGIRVNCVHPGTIMTPLNVAVGQKYPGGFDAYIADMSSLHPIGHLGEPEDVALAILYLASDEAKFVTGSDLVVDGGYTAQ
jgi:NAD(P)-dependent dehydrogenase (short-subunit alcohol dehydrogenase family)